MEKQKNPHHLVLGTCTDFLTGDSIIDSHDERYRQKIFKLLVWTFGFKKNEIESNRTIEVSTGKRKASLKVDCLVKIRGKISILVKYAPGSLVTRRISTLALSRIVAPYQIPFVVVTNGEDAEIIDGFSGKVI
jgi:hypothetical protein